MYFETFDQFVFLLINGEGVKFNFFNDIKFIRILFYIIVSKTDKDNFDNV